MQISEHDVDVPLITTYMVDVEGDFLNLKAVAMFREEHGQQLALFVLRQKPDASVYMQPIRSLLVGTCVWDEAEELICNLFDRSSSAHASGMRQRSSAAGMSPEHGCGTAGAHARGRGGGRARQLA
jgi:hypothetical protein